MARLRIAAVSYLNTATFVYGLEHEASRLHADLVLQIPALCARSILERSVDVALVPVAALVKDPSLEVITNYCIGANGAVRTVVVMSTTPIEQIETIMLDSHSRTSAALVKLLCREYWKISPRFEELTDYSEVSSPVPGKGYLLIGDKVFEHENTMPYCYDLALEWKRYTSLPFVFAAWVARPGVDKEAVAEIESALRYGVEHIEEAVAQSRYADISPTAIDYLTNNIDFNLDIDKRKALEMFLRKIAPVSGGASL